MDRLIKRTRKAHVCRYCKRVINPSSTCYYGEGERGYYHKECAETLLELGGLAKKGGYKNDAFTALEQKLERLRKESDEDGGE
ncbi:hypothetical protein A3A21_01675 [Candidatus Jorgensenbacteria bacterium RIFCSPLOWO2_01_FULL_45_25b]|uniref:Uncharacterized protein n=1 Tax=Candidatus Jorgensenbacteria bacterium RIFCSPLOWO2_01_FULL_45_25b TaxID=1798471 RepID=A0A1F6BTL8_9BACT|nr:MAG: hypothetical protein A3A21_01675 [Candidatus Jorgensenbacteria bacterium RIFCSPLOWO2_01_FULL_45_25b]